MHTYRGDQTIEMERIAPHLVLCQFYYFSLEIDELKPRKKSNKKIFNRNSLVTGHELK